MLEAYTLIHRSSVEEAMIREDSWLFLIIRQFKTLSVNL